MADLVPNTPTPAAPTAATDAQADEFPDTPAGWASRWQAEIDASDRELANWHKAGREVEKRYRCEDVVSREEEPARWELFTANTENQRRMLYAQVPKVTVSRRFGDAADDASRVAATMMERMLNTDIERASDTFAVALGHAVDDRLLPGFGLVRLRYEVETEEVPGTPAITRPDPVTGVPVEVAPAVPPTLRKVREDAAVDYCHWADVRWSPARTWEEVRWVAFGNDMSRRQMRKRFGDTIGNAVPLRNARPSSDGDGKPPAQPWARARVWEIWSKEDDRQVFWYAEGYGEILDKKPDPLGLDNFFPCPCPLLSLVTSSTLVPRPPYVLAQDLYREINDLTGRIRRLQEAIIVRGFYDKGTPELGQLLNHTKLNQMLPVENWARFMEKGGFQGTLQMFPLADIAAALDKLRDLRQEDVLTLMQLTGDSDLTRGQQVENGTPGEAQVKARFASLRGQSLQDKVAQFAADGMCLKAEIISKHFDVATIIARSNIAMTPDAKYAQQAAELIKSRLFYLKIEVKPEAVGMADFAAMKSERLEVAAGIANFISSATPIAQGMPGSMPFLLKILQWVLASMKGSQEIEGVVDDAIEAAEKAMAEAAANPQQPQVDQSKLMAEQAKQETVRLKGEQDLAKIEAETRADITRTQADVQAEDAKQRSQTQWNIRQKQAEELISQRGAALAAQRGPPKVVPGTGF